MQDRRGGASARPELLAPAGEWDCLVAAVDNGADAVYLGTREFNARVYARNFSLDELGRVVGYCHQRGVRVYLTLNTLVKNDELRGFFDVLARAYALGIDGVIIQHLSLLDIIKRSFPGLAVFMSTQAAIGNVSTASLVKSADRVILPRELSLAEIRSFIEAGVRVEVFVHGALCFSYSGLCLFSSFVSNRSGNRGCCAQLCRKKYGGAYRLSTRELCLVRRIPELIEAGVTGFKIEGRMRSPLYVAVATRLYRKAIDSCLAGRFAVPEKEVAEIEVVFNREFTEGFPFGDRRLLAPDKPMNRGAFLGAIADGRVELARAVAVGDGVGIWSGEDVRGAIVNEITVNGKRVDTAPAGVQADLHLPAGEGARVYLTSSPAIRIEPDSIVSRPPIPYPPRRKVVVTLPAVARRGGGPVKLLVKAYSLAEAQECARAGADLVFYNIMADDFPAAELDQPGGLGAYVPRIMSEDELRHALSRLAERRPAAVLCGNAGLLAHRADFEIPLYLDYSLNTFNDQDLRFFDRYRATPVLSPEMSLPELAGLGSRDAVVFCHGDVVLMNTRVELGDEKLVDEKGFVFPVRREAGYWQVLNSRPFGLFSDIRKVRELGFSQFLIDQVGRGAHFTRLYRGMLEDGKGTSDRRVRKGYTSGHLYRPVL